MAIGKICGLAVAAVLGTGLFVGQASAMPANGVSTAASQVTNGVQNVRLVCGPYRCWYRPGAYWGPRYYNYAGPHRYWRWHHWHHWHRGWW